MIFMYTCIDIVTWPGVFISNADGSILLATHSVISSEFDALSDSSWLMTSYSLAMAATQTLVSPSEIFGLKELHG